MTLSTRFGAIDAASCSRHGAVTRAGRASRSRAGRRPDRHRVGLRERVELVVARAGQIRGGLRRRHTSVGVVAVRSGAGPGARGSRQQLGHPAPQRAPAMVRNRPCCADVTRGQRPGRSCRRGRRTSSGGPRRIPRLCGSSEAPSWAAWSDLASRRLSTAASPVSSPRMPSPITSTTSPWTCCAACPSAWRPRTHLLSPHPCEADPSTSPDGHLVPPAWRISACFSIGTAARAAVPVTLALVISRYHLKCHGCDAVRRAAGGGANQEDALLHPLPALRPHDPRLDVGHRTREPPDRHRLRRGERVFAGSPGRPDRHRQSVRAIAVRSRLVLTDWCLPDDDARGNPG